MQSRPARHFEGSEARGVSQGRESGGQNALRLGPGVLRFRRAPSPVLPSPEAETLSPGAVVRCLVLRFGLVMLVRLNLSAKCAQLLCQNTLSGANSRSRVFLWVCHQSVICTVLEARKM